MNMARGIRLSVVLILAFQLCGCLWFEAKRERTARELAEDGMEAYHKGRNLKAIEAFEQLRDWYPFSQYAVLADLKLGDAHYARKEYEEAIFAYEEFENLHPKNEAVPYVVYQIGRCYFDRLQGFDRDQSMAMDAVQSFERLIDAYPKSPFAKKAHGHIRTCKRNMAQHELYVGEWYFKTKHYKAALERFKGVITSYPDLGVHHKAVQLIALCKDKMAEASEGRP